MTYPNTIRFKVLQNSNTSRGNKGIGLQINSFLLKAPNVYPFDSSAFSKPLILHFIPIILLLSFLASTIWRGHKPQPLGIAFVGLKAIVRPQGGHQRQGLKYRHTRYRRGLGRRYQWRRRYVCHLYIDLDDRSSVRETLRLA